MNKLELLKELYIMIQKKNYANEYGLGQRTGTSKDKETRSKDISAFLYDLFELDCSSPEEESILFMIGDAIHENISTEN